jgi:hypothetical protein
MNSINSENNDNLKNIIKQNNYSLDYANYYLSRMVKFLLNFILMYFFLEHIFNPNNELSRAQIILLICAYSAVILYILDFNFPSCSFSLN